jgi:thioredoxin reductase (NADPH)
VAVDHRPDQTTVAARDGPLRSGCDPTWEKRVAQPVLLAVDDDGQVLTALEQALGKRYGADYQVVVERSPAAGLGVLERLHRQAVAVAVVIADQWMPEMAGVEFLARAHQLHPSARRMLLVGVLDRSVNPPMVQAMALGRIDGWLWKPWEPAEEHLYLPVSEQLTEWIRATGQPGFVAIRIVGQQWTPRSHEIRDLLDRNAIPYRFLAHDSAAGRQLLRETGQHGARLPVLVLFDGRVLIDPTNAEVAEAMGAPTRPEPGRYDVIVVGAGPAGLSAATYGASEGLRTLLLEPEALGGQAGTSSLIRNYLGFPRGVSGRVLAQWASQQATLFGASFVYARATGLRPAGQDQLVSLADGSQAVGRTVIIATGAAYRRLEAPGVEELLGAGVFYGAAVSEAPAMTGSQVFVVGAGNSAGQAALHLAKYASRVTLLVRGGSLGRTMSDYLVKEIQANSSIAVRLGTQVVGAGGVGRLEHLSLRDVRTGATEAVPAAALFILIGAQPRTGWLASTVERDEQGFILTGHDLLRDGQPPGWPLERLPLLLETSIPGVFAAGDVRHRSIKRVASAVGEGSIAIQLVHEHLSER